MLISPDVSYFQKKVDSSYTRQWLIFRCCDGDFLDPNATFNADWCRGAVAQGRMIGWTTYVVYRPGKNGAVLGNLAQVGPLDRVMVDVESWAGQIRGDHSDEITSLVLDLAAIVGQANVWVYGNQSDLAEIYPRRLAGQLMVIPSWGPNKPNVANMIGWQYTQGIEQSAGRPLSSAPFGACDHNELYVDEMSPSGGGIPIPDPEEDDMLQPFAIYAKDSTGAASWIIALDWSSKVRIQDPTQDSLCVSLADPNTVGGPWYKHQTLTDLQLAAIPDVTDYP